MARCHQSHNIPWQALVDCLELFHHSYNHVLSTHEIDLRPKQRAAEEERRRQRKKFCHFTARVEATVADFSATERRKYNLETILKREVVFDDEFLSDILTPKYQSLDYWRTRERHSKGAGYEGGEDAEVIKELFNVNNMEALLLLVHTGVGIQDLECRTTHIAGFGFFHLAQDCMEIYVLLNHLIACGDIDQPHRWHSQWKGAVWRACSGRDLGDVQLRVLKNVLSGNRNGFVDYSGVRGLLNYCFRILYQYHMMAVEIHGEPLPEHLRYPEMLFGVSPFYTLATQVGLIPP